jgi:hypothetical protein
MPINGTDIQTGAAPDAIERLARYLVRQHASPPVVEQNDMKLLGTISG